MIVVLLGPPGAGKGTQAERIANKFNLNHFSLGSALRRRAVNDKELQDKLSSGSLLEWSYLKQICSDEIKMNKRIILDGLPRTMEQLNGLNEITQELNLDISKIFFINVSNENVEDRLLNRWICLEGEKETSGRKEDLEPICKGKLFKRSDDNSDAIKSRITTYNKETLPVVNEYKSHSQFVEIDGNKSKDDIFQDICSYLEKL